MEAILKKIELQLIEQNEAIRNLNSKVDSALQSFDALSVKLESVVERLSNGITSMEARRRPMVCDRQKRRRSLTELPVEIQSQILVRVPIKSILLCKCVCKSFRDLIQNPYFIQMHLNSIPPVPDSLILNFGDDQENYRHYDHFLLYVDHTRNNLLSSLFPTPPIPIVGSLEFHIVGSCNGLICAVICFQNEDGANCEDCNFLLWNPVIKQCRYLPKPLCTKFRGVTEFGFLPETNDYLIVKVNHFSDFVVEVYKMSIDSWIAIDCDMFTDEDFITRDENAVFLNGSFHWSFHQHGCDYILYYKLMNDELGRMKAMAIDDHRVLVPNELGRVRSYNQRKLAVIDESLATIFWNYDISTRFEVWIMNEYGVEDSWVMRFAIVADISRYIPPVVGYWTDANLMITERKELHFYDLDTFMLTTEEGGLYLYDPNTRRRKKFPEMETTWRIVGFCSFVETLVPVR